jgi:NADH-quinone oxidoreductase subunit J
LFVLMGAEFLAMLLVVVYVGAVAVLFLFVVMMLDVDFAELKQGFLSYLPAGALVALLLVGELLLVASAARATGAAAPLAPSGNITNAEQIGRVLYTEYLLVFQMAGLVLLVAMIGAIVLTLRRRSGVKKQDVGAQVGRRRSQAVELKDVRPGQGLG